MRPFLPVLAYLDPGSGSLLLQIVLGGTAAIGMTGRLLWRRLSGATDTVDMSDATVGPEAQSESDQ